MDASKMDRRIRIEQYTQAQDDYGEPIETWAVLDTVWAEVSPLSARELFLAQQVSAQADTRFRIRHRTDLTRTMRIVYDGATYDIYSIQEIGRREGLEILAKARVS